MRHPTSIGRLLPAALLPACPAAVLLVLAPPDGLAAAARAGAHAQDGGAQLLIAVTALAAWGVVGWLTTAVIAAALAAAPGQAGRIGRAVADHVTPTLLRRLLSGGTVAGLALAPVVLPAVAQAAGQGPTASCASAAPSLDRAPLDCPTPTITPTAIPRAPKSAPTGAPPSPSPRPAPDVVLRPAPTAVAPATVVVRRGDTLWGLARDELQTAGRPATTAAVAARWPAWWAANRAELGDDPGLIRPGEVLSPPTA